MNSGKIPYLIIILLIAITISACNKTPRFKLKFTLSEAGTNKHELVKVLKHYSEHSLWGSETRPRHAYRSFSPP